jgi:hypothetical protein
MDAFLNKRLLYRMQHLLQPTNLGAGQSAAVKDLLVPPTSFPWISIVLLLLGVLFYII